MIDLQEIFENYIDEKPSQEWHDTIEYYVGILQDLRYQLKEKSGFDYQHFNKYYQQIADTKEDFLDRYFFTTPNGIGGTGQSIITRKRRKEIRYIINDDFTRLSEIIMADNATEAFGLLKSLIKENKWVVIFRFLRTLFPDDLTAVDDVQRFNDLIKRVEREYNLKIDGAGNRFLQSRSLLNLIKGGDPIWRQIFFWDFYNGYRQIDSSKDHDDQEFIRSKIGSNTKYWFLNVGKRIGYKEKFDVGEVYGFKSDQMINLNIDLNDLVVAHNAPGGRIEGLFEVKRVNTASIECRYLYEFQNQTTIKELVDNPFLYDSGFTNIVLREVEEITSGQFKEIINTTELRLDEKVANPIEGKTNQQLSKSGFNSDRDYTEKDLLDIENDVRAFALLLASRNVNPPLAIALFGRWGSGKSFFMRHLEKRIKELSQFQRFPKKDEVPPKPEIKKEETEFCQGIAHIWFNAWSYLDANLWAGLAHSLFQKLNEYISNTTSGEIERLKIQVRITKRLQLLHGDLQNYTEKKASLEDLKRKLEREKVKRIANFFSSKYSSKVLGFWKENGLPESDAKQLTPEALKEKIQIGTNLLRYFKKNVWQLILLAAVIPIIFFAEELVGSLMNSWKPFLEDTYTKLFSVVVPIFIPIISFYRKKASVIRELVKNINELASSEESNDKEFEQLKKDIKEIDPIIQEIEESIHREYSLKPDITQLAIANFLSSKADQKEYIDRLGIVSVIRKDFETLSDLFYTEDGKEEDENVPETDTESKSEKQLREDRTYISEQFKTGQKLERIILYIDDLDRCSDAKVLEVVQAVHLLMAFPLFNVVVGVDKRCLHNALNYQYMLRYSEYKDTEGFEKRIKEVKPEEYIEKIFQIPFQLKDASNNSIKSFIDDLLKEQVLIDDERVAPKTELPLGEAKEQKPKKEKKVAKSVPEINDTPKNEEQGEKGSNDEGDVIITPKDLRLTKVELDLLKEIAWLLGNSPRTIKRFINIYRLIRAHEHLSYSEENKHDDFLAVMFLLALNIGICREHAEKFHTVLKSGENARLSEVFNVTPELNTVMNKILENDALKKLLDFHADRLMNYSEFVQRFSFSKVNEINELEALTE